MKAWFRGKGGGAIAFLVIAALVAGGLGWVTADALRMEEEQRRDRAQVEAAEKLRLALWKLDSRIAPVLAREDSRPYDHYSAVYAPSLALRSDGRLYPAGLVLEPSPLLNAELPDWILLHFQTDEEGQWESPQVLSAALAKRLRLVQERAPFRNVTAQRRQVLENLQHSPARDLLASIQKRGLQLTQEEMALVPAKGGSAENTLPMAQGNQGPYGGQDYYGRLDQQTRVMREGKSQGPQRDNPEVVMRNIQTNGQDWFLQNQIQPARSEPVSVNLSSMVPLWLQAADGQERLVVARLVQTGQKQVCQGMVLDWPRLQALLAAEVNPLFPAAHIEPIHEALPLHPERSMTVLPVQMDPGPAEISLPALGWTPLRVGLACAWAAALVALLAVGLGGWSLLALSERRIRFVSAVTHELRTPLTTLRLYLDMLATGMVRDEEKKTQYLQTLNTEADRLNRLVSNVLHYSRLENQRPRLQKTEVALPDLLDQVRSTWQGRCQDSSKELIVDNQAGAIRFVTDADLLQQVLGNLIDNACKYTRGAEDQRIWLRAQASPSHLVLDVEDRGPGVPPKERRPIFRPFRRGRAADVTAGGVGLGLALALRWTHLLGGRLTLHTGQDSTGACFRVDLSTRTTK